MLTCDLTCSVTSPVLRVRDAPVSGLPVLEPAFSASFLWMRLLQKTRHVASVKATSVTNALESLTALMASKISVKDPRYDVGWVSIKYI
jgi:hypothetical protein